MARRITQSDWVKVLALGLDVNFGDRELLALLFTRHLWQLSIVPELPSSFVTELPKLSVRRPADPLLEEQWRLFWDKRKKEIAAGLHDPPVETLTDRAALIIWLEKQPETWVDRISGYGIEMDSIGPWMVQIVTDAMRSRLEGVPELDVFDEVKSARDRGLREVVVLPFDTAYAEWVAPTTLFVSTATHNSLGDYAAALNRHNPLV
jgi:hypothetical protein